MKFLLVAVNAKYIHSNLGIYSLKAYAEKILAHQGISQMGQIEIGEYTINHQKSGVLKDIYLRKPDFIGISCYIWNIQYINGLISDLKKVMPDVPIWLGGPEVTYDSVHTMHLYPNINGIMKGEGEQTFAELVSQYLLNKCQWENISGLTYRDQSGQIKDNPARPVMDMDEIPFVYDNLEDFKYRIVYYESSRGCPFSCSYCLSSVEKSLRFRSLHLVEQELQVFLENKVPQVKFIDRTFNCQKEHTKGIWEFIHQHDNGITNFHFEVSADLITAQELELISKMRPGLIQLEIGVQSTHGDTIKEIKRSMKLDRLSYNVNQINQYHNTHQHLDLIAGLPFEDLITFQKSFNQVYKMKPNQLQLGFLKVLKGSYMEEMSSKYQLNYQSEAPYEVLSTKWLCYDEVIQLKDLEEMVEVYYNSGQFVNTIDRLEQEFMTPFEMFQLIAEYYNNRNLNRISHNRLKRYEILYEFILEQGYDQDIYGDLLMRDLYLRENVKSRPYFALDQSDYKKQKKEFFIKEAEEPEYLLGYEGYDSRQISKMAHIEVLRNGDWFLFDYKHRDPLDHNASSINLGKW